MKSYGDKDPGILHVEQIPGKAEWALARFFENVQLYETEDYSGYQYDEYQLELKWYESLETDIINNYDNMIHQAKIADAQKAYPEERILGMQKMVNGMLGIDTEVNGEAWFLVENQDASITGIRGSLDNFVGKIVDSPAEINENMLIIRAWEPGEYAVGDVRMYEGIPYRCVQAHDSTGNETWNPTVASLWMQYHGTSAATARPWIAPTGAHDMYLKGEWMIWTDGVVYCCLMDTVYSPADYAQAWEAAE